LLLDSFAWMEYFESTKKGQKVKASLDAAGVAYTSPTVLAEVFSKYARARGEDDARARVEFILEQCAVVEEDADVGVEAGRIHAAMKPNVRGFGLADAFILAAARARGVRVLTGDPHFAGVEDADML